MQFIDVELENFRSHEKTSYSFKDSGLTLIDGENNDEGGSNGAGKSSLWDGVSWCLFGETTSGIKGDEVVSRKSKKNCKVKVHLKVNGKDLFICRYRKDKEHKNNLIYNYNEEKPVLKGTTALTQKHLLSELEVDLDLFRTTVLFAQGKTFNFVDETDKKQKEILGKIVRISFEGVLKNAKEKFKKINDEIEGVDAKIDILNSRVEASGLDNYKEAGSNFDQTKKDEMRKCIGIIKETQLKISKIGPVEGDLTKDIVDLESKIEEIEEAQRDLESKRQKINFKKSEVNRAIDETESLGASCDKCGHLIDGDMTKKKLKESHEMIDKLVALGSKIPSMYKVSEKKECKDKIISLREKIEAQVRNKSQIEALEDHIAFNKEEIGRLKEKNNIWVEKIKAEESKLKEIELKIKEIEGKAEKSREDLAYWQFWVNGFGDKGIKSFIFDTICGQLTTRSNYFLDLLSNGTLSVSFDTQKTLKSGETREKFEAIVTKDGEDVEYNTFSGGEKRRIALAVDMALADLMKDFYGSDFNIVIFDEQTSYMDKEGRECFMTLLKEQSKERSVFVVDHDAEFKAAFDEVLTFKKEDGVTKIYG